MIWPLEIELRDKHTGNPIHRPVGIVAGYDTKQFVGTESGQIFEVDIKTGHGVLLNPGGDDQSFAGLCLDSRGPGTLYATGRDSGIVFAFNRRGELLRKYQITNHIKNGGKAFLANCIQTRYQLLITDAYNPVIYYLTLLDEGPGRGEPAPIADGYQFQGIKVAYEHQWQHIPGHLNAWGVEWSAKFNETAYVMNARTGILYSFSLRTNGIVPLMKKVNLTGSITTFPGAMHLLFDSTNENVLYVAVPHRNAIAAVEVSWTNPNNAKFIRFLESPLLDGPLAMGEYGQWIFPVSAQFTNPPPPNGSYTIVQLPRHTQIINGDSEFTTVKDDPAFSPPAEIYEPEVVENGVKSTPKPHNTSAPSPIWNDPNEQPSTGTVTITPNPESNGNGNGKTASPTPSVPPRVFTEPESNESEPEDNENACFPADAPVTLRNGRKVRMDELQIGDEVLVRISQGRTPVYSEVYIFSHRDRNVLTNFVALSTTNSQVLEVSPSHYVFVDGRLTAARNVRVGDILEQRSGLVTRVTDVRTVLKRGLYNPQTMDGDIVVADVRVSTYTASVEPIVAVAMMTPLRGLYMYGSKSRLALKWLSIILAHGGGPWTSFLRSGRASYS